MAATWTETPLIVKHAGSDLDRLMRIPELAATYKRILRSADAVITHPRLMVRFLGMGVQPARLAASPPLPVPAELFNPTATPLDRSQPHVPAIGIYGKIGISKGTFDLVTALGRLAAEGIPFELLAMIGSQQHEWISSALDAAGLSDRTRILPFAPHWRVPAFIRACTAVCFLERDFPISIHGPMVPREVLACATCLVVSGEVAAKQVSAGQFESGRNVVIVDDPKDHDALVAAIRPLLLDPPVAEAIGQRGHELSAGIEPPSSFGAAWQSIVRLPPEPAPGAVKAPTAADLLAPALRAAVEFEWPELSGLHELGADDPFEGAFAWCDKAAASLPMLPSTGLRDRLDAALRYQRLRLEATSDRGRPAGPPFPAPDTLGSDKLADLSKPWFVPVRGRDVHVESFPYDVPALFGDENDEGVDSLLIAMPEHPVRVLFQRTQNLIPRELMIDNATSELLAACDGASTVADVVRSMAAWFDVDEDAARPSVLAALQRLHDADVIAFLDRPAATERRLAPSQPISG
jgi:hypothetical protein